MSAALAILRKDLRVLLRSPLLLGALVAYPLLIAVLVGLVAGYATAKPRVAFVDRDGLPPTVELAGREFDVAATIEVVADEVRLEEMTPDEARRQLDAGRVVAVVTVPPGFVSDLRGMVRSPTLLLETTRGGLAPRVTQQMQALVYALNRELESAYVDANLAYVELLLRGGEGEFLGRPIEVLGLRRAGERLDELPPSPQVDEIRDFVRTAELALAQTDQALRVTANPIALEQAPERGRTQALSAQVQAYGLALTTTFLALLLAAGALAAERDENTIGRLARGLVSLGRLVAAKIMLAAVVALVLGLALALVFGLATEIGRVPGGQPWERVPLLCAGLLLSGAAVGALGALIGALARDARTASLVAVLVVLPIVFLGLVPREVVAAAGVASDTLPFAHAVRLFVSALYDADPWRTVAVEAAWLAGLAVLFGALARRASRRLLT
jgi:ABC-type transport system involved in cytochrome c biogenesis permease component